jgi:anion-transporting  ArsA/GET3 family ATPase
VTIREVLTDAAVVLCCGSGGVGKTTTAAVIGLEAAAAGRRVVVVTIDPARRLADALGLPEGLASSPRRIEAATSGHDRTLPTRNERTSEPGELWAMMLDTGATFDGLVRRYAADAEQVDRILGNRFYRNLASSMSGTQEYMAAEVLYELHHDDRFDLVVVDTPPSRHTLDFLDAPAVLSRFLDHKLFRLLMAPARGGLKLVGAATQPILRAIGRVVGSDVLADSVAFFQAFAGMETGFRERADAVVALLRAPSTAFVLVASPRHDTVAEAAWFGATLADKGVTVRAVVVNRVLPAFGSGAAAEATARASAATDEVVQRLWSNVADLRDARERELAVLHPLAGLGELTIVPLLDEDVHDLTGLRRIGAHL